MRYSQVDDMKELGAGPDGALGTSCWGARRANRHETAGADPAWTTRPRGVEGEDGAAEVESRSLRRIEGIIPNGWWFHALARGASPGVARPGCPWPRGR